MKGYKGMDAHMICRDFQYKIGKTYTFSGEIGLCLQGFHFCRNLSDTFRFYSPYSSDRFFEIEASDDIIEGNTKCVTSKIKIIRELSRIELNRAKYGLGFGKRYPFSRRSGNGNYGTSYGNGTGNGCSYGSIKGGTGRIVNGDGCGIKHGNVCDPSYEYSAQNILIFI